MCVCVCVRVCVCVCVCVCVSLSLSLSVSVSVCGVRGKVGEGSSPHATFTLAQQIPMEKVVRGEVWPEGEKGRREGEGRAERKGGGGDLLQ